MCIDTFLVFLIMTFTHLSMGNQPPPGDLESPEARVHRAAIKLRILNLQNLTARGRQLTVHTSLPSENQKQDKDVTIGGAIGRIVEGVENKSIEFRFLSGDLSYRIVLDQDVIADALKGSPSTALLIRTPGKVEKYLEFYGGKQAMGNIFASERLPDVKIDHALGLRRLDSQAWITTEDVDQWAIHELPGSIIEIRFVDEFGGTHRWRHDAALGYALREYEIRYASLSLAPYRIVNDDFIEVEGEFLPKTIHEIWQREHNGAVHVFQDTKITIDHYEVGKNEPDSIRMINWPAGIKVYDRRDGNTYLVDEEGELLRVGGDVTINDVIGFQSLNPPPQVNPSSRWYLAGGIAAMAACFVAWRSGRPARHS